MCHYTEESLKAERHCAVSAEILDVSCGAGVGILFARKEGMWEGRAIFVGIKM